MSIEMKEPRISTKRLRAAITKVNNARKFGIGKPPAPGQYPGYAAGVTPEQRAAWGDAVAAQMKYEQETSAARATGLYSLRSHLHGTLHITHQYVQKTGPGGTCREEMQLRTIDDQVKLINDLGLVQEFAMTPEELEQARQEQRRRTILFGTDEQVDAMDPAPTVEEVQYAYYNRGLSQPG